jgi:ABC-type polysaccharide/polyol phosphate transport system ATPase subunit
MAESGPAIVVDDVSKRFRLYKERAGSVKEMFTKFRNERYEDFWAVKEVSLQVEHGQVYGLVGHNGSGKSSLLKMMAGILKPTMGEIRTDGRISALLELGAGFHPDLTGRENIYLNAAILGLQRKEVDGLFDEIVDFSGLSGFIDSPVKHYSSGMFVRLGFSVAVHVNPQILIIDEVIAVGDEEFQRRCFEHLYKLRNNGVTIVMVTHSLQIVRQMCDRAAWIDHGQVMCEGPAVDVVHEYLDKVNLAEAERLQLEDEVRAELDLAAEIAQRVSTSSAERPIILREVEVLDENKRPTRLFRTSEPMTVRFHYDSRADIPEPIFSFAIESQNGVLVANPSLPLLRRPEILGSGRGFIDYEVSALALGPGEYSLSAAIHDKDAMIVLDKRERVLTFRVDKDEPTAGMVDLLGEWRDLELGEGTTV